MSVFKFTTTFNEVQIDSNNDYVAAFEIDLPHHDIITKRMCEIWNTAHMEKYYDGILDNKIESAIMRGHKSRTGVCEGIISIKTKPGVRLTEKYRNAIIDQTSAQLSDGIGESMFGLINIMTDGAVRFYSE